MGYCDGSDRFVNSFHCATFYQNPGTLTTSINFQTYPCVKWDSARSTGRFRPLRRRHFEGISCGEFSIVHDANCLNDTVYGVTEQDFVCNDAVVCVHGSIIACFLVTVNNAGATLLVGIVRYFDGC